MDVVALAQSGFGNAVATLGTACTAEHVQKLFRFTDLGGSASTATPPGAAPPGARWRPACCMRATRARCASCSCRPSTTRIPTCASSAPRPSSSRWRRRCRCRASWSRREAEVDTATAEGRARLRRAGAAVVERPARGHAGRQLLGQIASAGALPVEELAWWRPAGAGPGHARAAAGHRRGRRIAAPRRPMPPPVRGARCGRCCSKAAGGPARPKTMRRRGSASSRHGEAFRLIDRLAADEGTLPWASCASADRRTLGLEARRLVTPRIPPSNPRSTTCAPRSHSCAARRWMPK